MKRMQKSSLNFLTTLDKENNKFLSILYIPIKIEGNRFSTSVYRKKTSIRLFPQFNSFKPMSYKICLTIYQKRGILYKADPDLDPT